MITELIYFRPEKGFVDPSSLEKKYSCHITDEFTGSESQLTVPSYLTLIQYFKTLGPRKIDQLSHGQGPTSQDQFLEKLCIHLIGSAQVPRLQEFVPAGNLSLIDRIEFHGHIGYEGPVLSLLSQLPRVRKVSFSLNPCKQDQFKELGVEVEGDGRSRSKSKNNGILESQNQSRWVTSLKIAIEPCVPGCGACGLPEVAKIAGEKREVLQKVVRSLLKWAVAQLPQLKRLTMDVPNWEKLRDCIDETVKVSTRKNLKPTTVMVLVKRDWIIVRKTTDMPEDKEKTPTPEPPTATTTKAKLPMIPPPLPPTIKPISVSADPSLQSIPIPALSPSPAKALSTSTPTPTPTPPPLQLHPHHLSLNHQGQGPRPRINSNSNEPMNPGLGLGRGEVASTASLVDMSTMLGSMLGITNANVANASTSTSNVNANVNISVNPTMPNSNSLSSSSSTSSAKHNHPLTAKTASSSSLESVSYAAAAAASKNKLLRHQHQHQHHLHRGTGNDSQSQYEGSRRAFYEGTKEEATATATRSNNNTNIPGIADLGNLGKPVFSGPAAAAAVVTSATATSVSSNRHIKT